jgi:hypothetical protein
VPLWVATRCGLDYHNVGIPTAWSTCERLSGHVHMCIGTRQRPLARESLCNNNSQARSRLHELSGMPHNGPVYCAVPLEHTTETRLVAYVAEGLE